MQSETHDVYVYITPPESDGGSPILGYRIEVKNLSSNKWEIAGEFTATDHKLLIICLDHIAPNECEARVICFNKYGESAPSESERFSNIEGDAEVHLRALPPPSKN